MKNAKKKKQPKIIYYLSAPLRFLSSCRDFYTNTLCDCGRMGHVGQMASYVAIPHQLSHSPFSRSSSFKESKDIEDLRELIRVMTLKNSEKRRTNTNDERKLRAVNVDDGSSGRSYSGGVGQIGRIDEDGPCEFIQVVDSKKSGYPRCRSYARPTTRRVLL